MTEQALLQQLADHLDHAAAAREQRSEYDRGWIAAHRTIATTLRQRAHGQRPANDPR